MLVGLLERVDGGIDRLHGGLDQRGGIGRPPLEPAHRRRKCRHRRMVAADGIQRLAQVGGDLLALHHGGAAFGERGLLAVLGRKLLQFVGGVPQIVRLARGSLHAGAMLVEHGVGGAPCLPQQLQRGDVLLEAGKRVEQAPVGRGVDQRPLVMLAVNFDQRRADRFQRLHADRLIVDEGAGAAVGQLHAAQDHFTGIFRTRIVEPVVAEDHRRRMALRDIEHRGDLALLGAMPDQARVAAAAERQRECVEKDRLARAGLAGQDRKPAEKLDIEPFDQDDVTDRKTRQHAKSIPSGRILAFAPGREALCEC